MRNMRNRMNRNRNLETWHGLGNLELALCKLALCDY